MESVDVTTAKGCKIVYSGNQDNLTINYITPNGEVLFNELAGAAVDRFKIHNNHPYTHFYRDADRSVNLFGYEASACSILHEIGHGKSHRDLKWDKEYKKVIAFLPGHMYGIQTNNLVLSSDPKIAQFQRIALAFQVMEERRAEAYKLSQVRKYRKIGIDFMPNYSVKNLVSHSNKIATRGSEKFGVTATRKSKYSPAIIGDHLLERILNIQITNDVKPAVYIEPWDEYLRKKLVVEKLEHSFLVAGASVMFYLLPALFYPEKFRPELIFGLGSACSLFYTFLYKKGLTSIPTLRPLP